MKENILHKVSQKLSSDLSDKEIFEQLLSLLNKLDKIYSYLIYANYKDDELTEWQIDYTFSQVDKYNTLSTIDVIDDIILSIHNSRNSNKRIVGYKQPAVELMMELYSPLMNKLVLEQCHKWNELEYDDAMSICKLTMMNLYSKGYYIHKYLLRKSFENSVLMELRKNKNKPEILSLEQLIFSDGRNEPITIADVIADDSIELENEQLEEEEFIQNVFNEVKEILVDYMGERQFNQFLRDYGNKHTTNWSRKKMQQVKDKFKRLGITWKSFDKYL
jgi:hypothetical protein